MGNYRQDCNCNNRGMNRGYNRVLGNRYRCPVKEECEDLNDIEEDCRENECGYENIDSFPIAMAYVPWQCWKSAYDAHRALEAGTIFPELVKPFLGSKCGCRM